MPRDVGPLPLLVIQGVGDDVTVVVVYASHTFFSFFGVRYELFVKCRQRYV